MKNQLKKGLGFLFLFLIQYAAFSQADTLCGKKTYATVNVLYGTTYNAFNASYSADQTAAQPMVTPQNMINGKYKAAIGIWSPWQLPPAPPTLIASQGDFDDQITLSWEANPLSPRPTGFVLYRDGAYLEDLAEDINEYVDRFVQAGEFYQYSIAAKNAFGTGSTNKFVGFVNPNGVVSGKIETNSGNAVPGVEVRLTPLTGNSMSFNGVDGQLCVSYNTNFPTAEFTVSAYVKQGANTNDEAGIIDWGSTLNKNWWITTLPASEGKGYVFHIGNGTGSDTLKYHIPVNSSNLLGNDEKWHQITMMYNGSTMTVLVDGVFVGTKAATLSAEIKQRLTIGSKLNDAYFKGLIDDVRIYDRQLTQTEINATKNRSISKTEKGLKAYWKMDEGIGTKTFDNSNSLASANLYGGVSFSEDKADVYNAGVSDETGYYLIDGVNYSNAESFRATPMKNFEFNTALEFTAADMAYGNLTDFNIPDEATVEVLFHPFDLKSRQTILSKENLFELYISDAQLSLNLNGTTTSLGAIQAEYYLITVVMNKTLGTAKVYIDDALKTEITFAGNPLWANGKPWVIATNDTTTAGDFYTGLIDEVAIFKKHLTLAEIQLHSTVGIPDDSTRANLYSYFDLNEGTDTKVYDYYAANADIGEPRIGIITRATWSNNVRRKVSVPHEFQPNVRVVNLNNSNTAIGNIDFKDVSTVNISGTVRFANTFCFADKVEILVNGQSHIPAIVTDIKGKWSADFEPGANVVLKPFYKDHVFTPERIEFRKLQAPKAGLVFLDNTKRTISGQIAGGLCKKSIIPAGSRVVVKIATLDGCFEKTDTVVSITKGTYSFTDLPARAFRVSVVEHSNSVIYDYFQLKGGEEVDLRDVAADTVNFIYFSNPILEITGITPNTCGVKTTGQGVDAKIDVKVYEEYYGEKCYVKGFKLNIDDPTTGTASSTQLAATDSLFTYNFKPQIINIIPPYLQTITVSTEVNGSTADATTQFAVLGLKSSGKSFVANTPEMPSFILRDPPGDASYASLEKGSTICTSISTSIVNNLSEEIHNTWSIGGTQIIGGFGFAIETSSKASVSVAGGSDQSWTSTSTDATCMTTLQTITTSPNDVVVGSMAGGDVYIGTSNAITYGEAVILNYDFANCTFKDSTVITIDNTELNTDFYYSENFIVNKLIPKLDSISSDNTVAQIQRDNARNGKNLWKSFITKNREDIITDNPNASLKSFDAGAIYEEASQYEITDGESTSFESAGWVEAAIGAEFSTGVVGWNFGASIRFDSKRLDAEDSERTRSTVITYHLEDDDAGDNFLMKIHKNGKIWGSPIFELIAGESSCPWETGTKARTEPSLLSADGTIKTNVPANTAAIFKVNLGNLSPTKEGQRYHLSLVPESNPNGATLKANGQGLTAFKIPYIIPYGEDVEVLVTVQKGPIAYDYNDLQIRLEYECETAIALNVPSGGGAYADTLYGKNLVDSLFVRTLNLSVSFIEPCSPVDIGFPLQDFVVTPAAQNKLSITLDEYDKSDTDLQSIRLQYRPIGGDGSWINISETLRANLGDMFTIKEWNTALLKDGEYEIRAVTQCISTSLAPGISTIVRGKVERNPPEVVGVPQPADGTWDIGDEISITFNEDIDCNKLVAADVLGNNTIGLYDATTNALVAATFSCVGNKIIIVPTINPKDFENRAFRVTISGKEYDDAQIASNPNYQRAALRDKAGNMIPSSILWEFAVNQNDLEWVGTDIIEVNTVLNPYSVKRQIRNRGGSITSFRMEDVPSWLTISPATGTLNPGQSADITFTFQTDLLIGDYTATPKLVGSKGAEPMGIDYRVRCEAPVFAVDNPAQYQGSMNMVIDLNIFGVTSTDPSDIIVAKIDGQIRGVGNVAYYRNIPADKQRWLTFMTIYADPSDIGKPIEFNVWDGDKCNQYVEVLEQINYEEGQLVGSPLEPQAISVLNLVSKCIPLNRGFNWVSFNLDLGTGKNSVTNTLASLRTKTGAYIKTNNSFAEYLNSSGTWDPTSLNILPTKRYMLYVTGKDTVCIKGSPYTISEQSISIKNGWNWVGYVPSTGMTVSQALAGLTPLNGDLIKSQTLFAQYVAGVGWIGNLNFMEPLKGYLLKIGNAGTLTYPSTNTNGLSSLNSEGITLSDNKTTSEMLATQAFQEPEMTFDFTKYSGTMNLIGKIKGMTIAKDDELRAYIDGKLVGKNKSITNNKTNLFFQTIYYDEQRNISFKLFKADRSKEFDLNKSYPFQAESLLGLVTEPIVFEVIISSLPPVQLSIPNNVIWKPSDTFPSVSIPGGFQQPNANCSTFTFNSILPTANEPKPICNEGAFEGNMSTVIKLKYSELNSFVSANDVLTFLKPSTSEVLGCATFNDVNGLFYSTIGGVTTVIESAVDVQYYSDAMKKTFLIQSAFMYQYNTRKGNADAPFEIDISPLSISSDVNGLISVVLKDANWTGKYAVNAFAMNCTNTSDASYSDGQTSFYFQRLGVSECIDIIDLNVSANSNANLQALKIYSESVINTGISIEYKAGNSIELLPGFETQTGTIFTGKIEGCTNKN
jgi:hypothetical protein